MVAPFVVLGDLHLTRASPPDVSRDLAAVLAAHAGRRVVFDGDLFDWSADAARASKGTAALADVLGRNPIARAALGDHVGKGGELWLVSGNHDADLGAEGFRAALCDALDLAESARARVRVTPWFFRDGGVHVEHGHLFDPDNAPAHPLVVGEPSLGVHFVEQFIAPAGAHRYLNANDRTPLDLFLASFAWYGPRAPYVIYRYFYTAFTALARSGPLYRAAGEGEIGARRVADFAEAEGVDAAMAAQLVGLGARPTLESLAATFSRLYLDRVAATVALTSGLGAAAAGRLRLGAMLGAAGALAMSTSWALGKDRYGGSVPARLEAGAAEVAKATGAEMVIFGHTHREADSEAYANTGSFAFPAKGRGRPYLVVDCAAGGRPRAERRYG
ncbi:MAG TPA: metallophosphoesterase [Byssovorax sp.]